MDNGRAFLEELRVRLFPWWISILQNSQLAHRDFTGSRVCVGGGVGGGVRVRV